MKKNNYNLILGLFLAIFLSACGGGGSSSSSSNDTTTNYFPYAWSINKNINSSYKKTYNIADDASINIADAWANNKGETVKVAIIDEDFEVTHPAFKNQIVSTYNVMDNSTTVSGTTTETDSHGTEVAGIIAAQNIGVAPKVELILINLDLTNAISENYFIEAFDKAKELGAQVINCSWGTSNVSQAFQSKLDELKNENIHVIFASGNDGLNLDYYDDLSELDTVIGVGATTVLNDVASYSNYGSKIDILAPAGGGKYGGRDLLGIITTDLIGIEGANSLTQLNILDDDYTFTAGTSFAAPTLTGVIALMLSANPNLSPDEIRSILIGTADKVGIDYGADYSINNFDTKRAYGKVNASKAVQEAINSL